MDVEQFLKDVQDHLAPRLDTYEQAIYLYVFRHTRLLDEDEAVVGLRSARRRIACGIGEKGKPMSAGTAYRKLQSLQDKGCVELVSRQSSFGGCPSRSAPVTPRVRSDAVRRFPRNALTGTLRTALAPRACV